mmetsp:Transcript_54026/g.169902  ORF Transcript_54026/g.169902 Transcript_54026/m.169902 type:complete len:247 (+) Transcript_54026:28-768(+)
MRTHTHTRPYVPSTRRADSELLRRGRRGRSEARHCALELSEVALPACKLLLKELQQLALRFRDAECLVGIGLRQVDRPAGGRAPLQQPSQDDPELLKPGPRTARGLDGLLEPFQALLERGLEVRAAACGPRADSIGLDGSYDLEQLPRELLMPPPALLELLQALGLERVLQIAEACLEVIELGSALLHGALLRMEALLQGRQADEGLWEARLRSRVVLHSLSPLGIVHMEGGIELPVIGLCKLLRV